jgi:cyclopropane-fatty-acyl-phospholipid synthase
MRSGLTLRWFADNARQMPGFSGSSATTWFLNVLGFVNRVKHFFRPNTVKISRKNIAEHYDIGNRLYELMLGKTMAYSCGIFRKANESLDAAQERKFDSICRKLQLKKSDQLLEIGSGWGGFAIYAARNTGAKTITISAAVRVCAASHTRQRLEKHRSEDLRLPHA